MITKTRILSAAVLATLALAAPATAAPDRTAELNTATKTFSWSGGDGVVSFANQFPIGTFDTADPGGSCNAGPVPAGVLDYCDTTLVKVTEPGVVEFALPTAGDGLIDDWDMYVYTADAAGAPGELLHSGEEIGGAESFTLDEAEGNYLVVAVPYQSVTSGFAGTLGFSLPEPVEE